jgi:hypothetical protein
VPILLSFGADVLSGLNHLWECRIGFCDIKSTSIFISNSGHVLCTLVIMVDWHNYRESNSLFLPADYVNDCASRDYDSRVFIVCFLSLTYSTPLLRSLSKLLILRDAYKIPGSINCSDTLVITVAKVVDCD